MYRVLGLASTHVYILVDARSEAEARRKATEIAPMDWKQEACGVPADVTISDVALEDQNPEGS